MTYFGNTHFWVFPHENNYRLRVFDHFDKPWFCIIFPNERQKQIKQDSEGAYSAYFRVNRAVSDHSFCVLHGLDPLYRHSIKHRFQNHCLYQKKPLSFVAVAFSVFDWIGVDVQRLCLQPIHHNIQTEPHHVHKVPVPGCRLESKVAVGCEVALDATNHDEKQHDGTNSHVKAVKPRQHVKG